MIGTLLNTLPTHFLYYYVGCNISLSGFSAAFKVIKSWLPPKAVQKIKFLSKSNLKEYVAPEQALKSWGGLDEYVFEFVPEAARGPSVEAERKKVHFADRTPEEPKPFPEAPPSPASPTSSSSSTHRVIIISLSVVAAGVTSHCTELVYSVLFMT